MSELYCEIMGRPTITAAAGTAATSGDNTIIAAPGASKRIVLLYYQVQNESSTGTTVQIKHGSTVVARVLLQNQGDAYLREYEEFPMLLPENTALVFNLSGANSHGYTVEYTTLPYP